MVIKVVAALSGPNSQITEDRISTALGIYNKEEADHFIISGFNPNLLSNEILTDKIGNYAEKNEILVTYDISSRTTAENAANVGAALGTTFEKGEIDKLYVISSATHIPRVSKFFAPLEEMLETEVELVGCGHKDVKDYMKISLREPVSLLYNFMRDSEKVPKHLKSLARKVFSKSRFI